MSRLEFFLGLLFVGVSNVLGNSSIAADTQSDRPNILWITCEDTSPDFGCYGDSYAVTPNVDRLAAQGTRYNLCFSHAPVCAPSRSGLILGMYPTTVGSHHMRSQVPPRADWRTYSSYLREAGYYCTNNSKTDYNFPVPKDAWDENGPKAHFRNRPNKSQPFFAIFNDTVSHESQSRPTEQQYAKNTRRLTPEQRHDPAKAKLPAYLPDTPVVRKNWAICYDNVTAMDYTVGDLLAQLEADGLADNTVVFFYGDHGRGLTRGKRWLYDSGTRVPLVIRWPGKIKPQTVSDDLVAFVDLGPTVLSIAGIKPPANMQGQPLLGKYQAPTPREYVYGARDRMDERIDMFRSVRDKQFKYIRNYMPWQPYAQHIDYMTQMPMYQELVRLRAAGVLHGAPALWMAKSKPVEELYDCVADRDEVVNLAEKPEHRATLERMRAESKRWMIETNDLGLLPEALMLDRMAADPNGWREKIVASGLLKRLAEVESLFHVDESATAKLVELSRDPEPAIRYWAVTGLRQRAVSASNPELFRKLVTDESPLVRIAAADQLGELGKHDEGMPILIEALKHDNFAVAHSAALALDSWGEHARPALSALQAANAAPRGNDYVTRVSAHVIEKLGASPTKKRNK